MVADSVPRSVLPDRRHSQIGPEEVSPGFSPDDSEVNLGMGDTSASHRTQPRRGSNEGRTRRDTHKSTSDAMEIDAPHGSSDSTIPGNKALQPPLSVGDPKQFILSGSIGDRRVRVLVDTGATISFISKTLVPRLKPKPARCLGRNSP